MSFIQKAILQVKFQPCIQFVRFGRRINIKKPRAPFYEKARILSICEPVYINPNYKLPISETCKHQAELIKKEHEENPFEVILARECANWFKHSKMVAIFHTNPIKEQDKFKIRVLLKKQNMTLKLYGKMILKRALEATKYREILPLFEAPNILVFSDEVQFAALLKICKKAPQFVLLCCIADNKILSKSEIIKYSNIPDLKTAQASLVSVLNTPASFLVQNLTHHQRILVNYIDNYAEQLKEPNKPEEKSDLE